jgi:hypothetical protein
MNLRFSSQKKKEEKKQRESAWKSLFAHRSSFLLVLNFSLVSSILFLGAGCIFKSAFFALSTDFKELEIIEIHRRRNIP